jgi:hypothetical protein
MESIKEKIKQVLGEENVSFAEFKNVGGTKILDFSTQSCTGSCFQREDHWQLVTDGGVTENIPINPSEKITKEEIKQKVNEKTTVAVPVSASDEDYNIIIEHEGKEIRLKQDKLLTAYNNGMIKMKFISIKKKYPGAKLLNNNLNRNLWESA